MGKCQISGRKKSTTHTPYVEDSTQAERERREKGRESEEEEEDRRLRRLPLPPFLSPTFFWEEEDVLDDERERTIDRNCDTSRLYYYNLCAEREHETRARESERKREKRGGGRSTSLSLAGVLCWIA